MLMLMHVRRRFTNRSFGEIMDNITNPHLHKNSTDPILERSNLCKSICCNCMMSYNISLYYEIEYFLWCKIRKQKISGLQGVYPFCNYKMICKGYMDICYINYPLFVMAKIKVMESLRSIKHTIRFKEKSYHLTPKLV